MLLPHIEATKGIKASNPNLSNAWPTAKLSNMSVYVGTLLL